MSLRLRASSMPTSNGRWRGRLRPRRTAHGVADDGGFILLESMISLTLIAVIMGSLITFFVATTRVTGEMRAKQGAATVASNMIDIIRGLQPTDSYSGRSAAAVRDQFAAAPAGVQPYLSASSMYPAWDNSGATPQLAMSCSAGSVTTGASGPGTCANAPASANNVRYTVTNYIGTCGIPIDATQGSACLASCPAVLPAQLGSCTPGYLATGTGAVPIADYVRVVVAVTWRDSTCTDNICSFVTASLLSVDSDPGFLLNTAPPAEPVITSVGTPSAAIGDAVDLSMTLATNTGVNPFQWTDSGTLPSGLSIDADTGRITGTVDTSATVGNDAVTITVTDAFGRQDTSAFTWKVLADLIPSGPAAISSTIGKAITGTYTASGGAGSPFTWSVASSSSLPPGLNLAASTGALTGSVTTGGTYATVLQVADKSGRLRTKTVSFTVDQPTVSGLSSAFTVMPAWSVSTPLAYTCPSGSSCSFTLSGAPTGVGLTKTAGATTGSASVSVSSSTTGTIYLVGAIPSSGSGAPWSITVTPRDTTNSADGTAATSTWRYSSANAGAANLTVRRGNAIAAQTVNYACANTCIMSFTGTSSSTSLPGMWLATTSTGTPTATIPVTGNGSAYLTGTMPASALAGTYAVTLVIKDTANNSLTEPASWVVTT